MIGIFDSGAGGLTVLRALRARMPQADVLYFGDTHNAPYGNRTHDDIVMLTDTAFALLRAQGATRILSACNSVSVSLTLPRSSKDVIEMVGPTVASLRRTDARIGLVATAATVGSGMYEEAFRNAGKEITAFSIPELAGAIEAGMGTETIDRIVANAMEGMSGTFDVLILACTHYPLVRESFERALPGVRLIDPAEPVGDAVVSAWAEEEAGTGMTTFLISKDSPVFRSFVATLFPESAQEIKVLE